MREILTAGCKSKIAAQTAVQGKADASRARRNPIDAAAGKAAPRAGEGQCPSPLFWEVVELADSQRQDVRALIPQPFLLVRSFQSLHVLIPKTKAMPIFEEGFILRNHAIVVCCRATDAKPFTRFEAKGRACRDFFRTLTEALIKAAAERSGPAWIPPRSKREALRLRCIRKVECVDILSDADFVPGLLRHTGQRVLRAQVFRMCVQDLAKLRLCLATAA